MPLTIWPLIVYFVLVIGLLIAMLSLSAVLGERHQQPATGLPYEGGVESAGGARVRLSVRFYLVAMFFVVFDLEAVFVLSWAIAVRSAGWYGYGEVAGFIVVLLLTLLYLARIGALDWSELQRRARLHPPAELAAHGPR